MPTLIPRKHNELPKELFERGGYLDHAIDMAATLRERKSHNAAQINDSVRNQIHRLCPDYQVDQSADPLICTSGAHGDPKRPECINCRLADGNVLFGGDLVPVTALTQGA